MTGPEHYRMAEQLLKQGLNSDGSPGQDTHPGYLCAAQVHATLAVAAATGLNESVTGMPHPDRDGWLHTAGTRPPAQRPGGDYR